MDNRTPKHRTACDACKRMKIKCDWDPEATKCNRCYGRGMDCTVTTKERKKREKKKNNHTTTLEDRLKRMESVMMGSGLTIDSAGKERRSSEDIETQAEMIDQFSTLNIDDSGAQEFVGAASGFSIFSPEGVRIICSITEDHSFSNFVSHAHLSNNRLPITTSLWHTISENERTPLPPREVADPILQFLFDRFIPSFPLFDRKQFMDRYSRQYPVKCSDDPAWYTCLNVCFAIASIVQKQDLPEFSPSNSATSYKFDNIENLTWWKWLRNATSTFMDLQFGPPSLTAVQAMAGLTFILGTLPNPHPTSIVAASTLSMAQAVGLHRRFSGSGLDEDEIEQRRNVFWIAVIFERGIVCRSGRPSVMHDEDIGIDLPAKEIIDGRVFTFRHKATLALLQGRIYNRLYSAKSLTRSKSERLKLVGILDDELQQWRENVPIEVRPGHSPNCDANHIITVVCLQWIYWNCIISVHRVSAYYRLSSQTAANGEDNLQTTFDPELNPRVYASAALCANAARSAINLLDEFAQVSSPLETTIIRMSDYFPLSACLTLFFNILQNPHDPQARSDVGLMNKVTNFFVAFEKNQVSVSRSPVLPIFLEINRVAAEYVTKAQAKASKIPKRSRAQSFGTKEPALESDESENEDYEENEQQVVSTNSQHHTTKVSDPPSSSTTHLPDFTSASQSNLSNIGPDSHTTFGYQNQNIRISDTMIRPPHTLLSTPGSISMPTSPSHHNIPVYNSNKSQPRPHHDHLPPTSNPQYMLPSHLVPSYQQRSQPQLQSPLNEAHHYPNPYSTHPPNHPPNQPYSMYPNPTNYELYADSGATQGERAPEEERERGGEKYMNSQDGNETWGFQSLPMTNSWYFGGDNGNAHHGVGGGEPTWEQNRSGNEDPEDRGSYHGHGEGYQ